MTTSPHPIISALGAVARKKSACFALGASKPGGFSMQAPRGLHYTVRFLFVNNKLRALFLKPDEFQAEPQPNIWLMFLP
jgi:hypothetical protein